MDFIEDQKDILEFFGVETQQRKLSEELSALKISFMLGRNEKIKSELADVHNLIMQLIGHYGVQEIYDKSVQKIHRTKRRIKEGYYK
jgi:hypothetical protein